MRIAIHGSDSELIAKPCEVSFRLDYDVSAMRDLLVLFVHLVVTTVRLMRSGGARTIVAESLLLKQQLLIITRCRRRAPDLRPLDRIVVGLCGGFVRRARLHRCAIVLKPATILSFQRSLVKRKYRELFSPIGADNRIPRVPVGRKNAIRRYRYRPIAREASHCDAGFLQFN